MALPGRGWEENPSQVTGQHRQQCKHGAQREHGARHGPHVAPHGAGEALTARHGTAGAAGRRVLRPRLVLPKLSRCQESGWVHFLEL